MSGHLKIGRATGIHPHKATHIKGESRLGRHSSSAEERGAFPAVRSLSIYFTGIFLCIQITKKELKGDFSNSAIKWSTDRFVKKILSGKIFPQFSAKALKDDIAGICDAPPLSKTVALVYFSGELCTFTCQMWKMCEVLHLYIQLIRFQRESHLAGAGSNIPL